MEKKLYKSENDKVLAGVCGGIAEYFVVDSVIIRLLWVVFTLLGGSGLIAYIIAAIIMPSNPLGYRPEDISADGDYNSNSPRRESNRNTALVFGVLLILFGGLIVVKDFIPWIHRDLILAALLIGLGLFFLVKRK